jgi:hypothetical protein
MEEPMFNSPCLQDKDKWEKYIRARGFIGEDVYDYPIPERPKQETYEVKIRGRFERTFEFRAHSEGDALQEGIGEIDDFIENACGQNNMKVWID